MSDENYDISQVEVPESFIQQILEDTAPMEESEEEVRPEAEAPSVPQNGQVVELLSLLFEEFDKLNSRFDKLQESINEMATTAGTLGTGPGPLKKKKKTRKTESQNALAELLAQRIR